MKYTAIFLFIFGLFVWAQPGCAQDSALGEPERYVEITAFAESDMISAGDEIWIGIHQDIYEGWHTYWKNPGDSGAEAYHTWTLPEGFEISDIHWPVPKKVPYEPLLNYGYEEQVTLLQKLSVPQDYDGAPITLNLRTDILVCEEICIPESQELVLNLNTGQSGNAQPEKIEAALKTLPEKIQWEAVFNEQDGKFIAQITGTDFSGSESFEFFPLDWGLVSNPDPSDIRVDNGIITITQPRGERAFSELDQMTGVVVVDGKGFEFEASKDAVSLAQNLVIAPQTQEIAQDITGVWQAVLFALIGGIILNLMPCVFPVLSIKALSLVRIADEAPGAAKIHGLAYTAGILLSFGALAGVLIGFKAAGTEIGWGFQLQDPLIVGALAYLLFVVGLNLSGVFEFGSNLGNVGSSLVQGQGVKSSFFTGVLAAIVATPCTAPFMAGAIGFALVQPPVVALAVFLALGCGLALPYLLLSFAPNLGAIMPKPGAWMEKFKQFLAFPMFASAVWLLWVVSIQSGSGAVIAIGMGFVLLGFGLWLISAIKNTAGRGFGALSIIAAIVMLFSLSIMPQNPGDQDIAPELNAQIFSHELLTQKRAGFDPVFVEMTAAWCITCKVNHAVAINVDATRKLFAEENVQYLVGDWTNKDDEITRYLQRYGRNGVPIYVYYGPPGENGVRPDPVLLPQILTSAVIRNYLQDE